jgi:hypothetical protein
MDPTSRAPDNALLTPWYKKCPVTMSPVQNHTPVAGRSHIKERAFPQHWVALGSEGLVPRFCALFRNVTARGRAEDVPHGVFLFIIKIFSFYSLPAMGRCQLC